ncbi:hypothetical protein HK104_009163 [Borealophlyctis nickersoniae]|nr:hypothetical protein HK104_009163 [Borealophlyctis nickersoniae]
MTQGNDVSAKWALGLVLVEDIQLLSFSFRPDAGFGGMPSWTRYIFNPLSFKPHSQPQFAVLFYFALSFMVVIGALTVFVGLQLKAANMKSIWPLQLLRVLIKLVSTILLIPIVEIFIYGAICHDPVTDEVFLLEDPSKCVDFLHLMIPAFFGVLYLLLQAPIMSLVFFHLDPASKHPDSKTTGRMDMLYTILRFALVIIDEIGHHEPRTRIAATVLVSAIMFVAMARYQPFFDVRLNDVRSGIFAASTFSGIQAGICYALGGFQSVAPFAIMCALLAPGFVVGFVASSKMRQSIVTGVYQRIKAREEQLESGTMPFPGSLQGHFNSQSTNFKREGEPHRSGVLKNIEDIVMKVSEVPMKVFRKAVDVEIACRFLQYNKEPEASVLADAIFNAGLEQFPNMGGLALMKAYYIGAFSIAETSHISELLDSAKCLKPAIDVRFLIFFEERQQEQEDHKEHLMTSQLNVTRYTESITLQSSARKYHLEALLSLKALWEYMKSERVSPSCIPYLLEKVALNSLKADKIYDELLDKYPNSKNILRKYSTFLMIVRNDHEKATKLLARAEDIENAEVRENTIHMANMRDQDSFAPNFGIGTINEASFVRDDSMLEAGIDDSFVNGKNTFLPEAEIAQTNKPAVSRSESATGFNADSEQQGRKIGFHKDVANVVEPAREWKDGPQSRRGPASVGSVPSATSSQREIRQFRYYRTVLEAKLVAPAQSFALAIASIATGQYPVPNITDAISYQKTLFSYTLNNIFNLQIMPILQEHSLNEPATIVLRETRVPEVVLAAYNPYFIGKLVVHHGQRILNSSDSEILDPSFQTSSDLRIFMDNIQAIANGMDSVAGAAFNDFLNMCATNTTIIYGLLSAIPVATLLIGYFLFRRAIANTNRKSVQLLSLALQIPRKYVNEKVDSLEVEIENIMEEIEQEREGGNPAPESGALSAGAIPPESLMRGYAGRKMTKRYALSLVLVAITGTVMFIPAIIQNRVAAKDIYLIQQISQRAYYALAVASMAAETAARDNNTWVPGTPDLWYKWYLNLMEENEVNILQRAAGISSLLDFPTVTAYSYTAGNCYNTGPYKCNPETRHYNDTIGFTPNLTLSSLDTICSTYLTHALEFSASPPENRTFTNPHMPFLLELVEDIASATVTANGLISHDSTSNETE